STAELEVLGAEANANNLKNSPSKSASQARFAHSPLVVPQTPMEMRDGEAVVAARCHRVKAVKIQAEPGHLKAALAES
ncbi:MAG: hypothetical protein ACRD1I_04160, partial [Terriglobia bacterium]